VSTVGFPDSTVRESRDRVRAAIRNAGLEFPIERITEAGLIGVGGVPHPGEISLARHGVLFLDAGPVPSHLIEAPCQALEDTRVVLSRVAGAAAFATFPARRRAVSPPRGPPSALARLTDAAPGEPFGIIRAARRLL
jgi:magnesium chelatase family protein